MQTQLSYTGEVFRYLILHATHGIFNDRFAHHMSKFVYF